MRWEIRTSSGYFIALRYDWASASRTAREFSNRWWERLVIFPADWPEWSVPQQVKSGTYNDIGPWSD